MSKKKKQIDARLLILENCDRETILEVAKILLKVVSETEQYFKELYDIEFFLRHSEQVFKRESKVKKMLFGLHSIFKD